MGAAHESRNIKHLKAAIRDADKLERDSLNIYVCRDSEAYMSATKTLLEVEADVKEKFGTKKQTSSKKLIEDKYQGPSMLAKTNMKFARDQLRKVRVGLELIPIF